MTTDPAPAVPQDHESLAPRYREEDAAHTPPSLLDRLLSLIPDHVCCSVWPTDSLGGPAHIECAGKALNTLAKIVYAKRDLPPQPAAGVTAARAAVVSAAKTWEAHFSLGRWSPDDVLKAEAIKVRLFNAVRALNALEAASATGDGGVR